jgi:Virulence-associated protein and related proteins
MLAEVVRIGNSKGIRLPAYILKDCNIADKVDMEIIDGKIIITPVNKPRENWNEKFKDMRENNEDTLLIDDGIDADLEDWEW